VGNALTVVQDSQVEITHSGESEDHLKDIRNFND
jgi:hypothetical protein